MATTSSKSLQAGSCGISRTRGCLPSLPTTAAAHGCGFYLPRQPSHPPPPASHHMPSPYRAKLRLRWHQSPAHKASEERDHPEPLGSPRLRHRPAATPAPSASRPPLRAGEAPGWGRFSPSADPACTWGDGREGNGSRTGRDGTGGFPRDRAQPSPHRAAGSFRCLPPAGPSRGRRR